MKAQSSKGKIERSGQNERVTSIYVSGMEWGLFKIRVGMRKIMLEQNN